MSLAAGTRLGAYEILAGIGEGGMGEVYRARDTKLNRDVAIKILPALFASDPDRVGRFEREAQTLASLNHPNIAQIYGVTESPAALVMELVEGEDLAQRLSRGAIPHDDALAIARQVAEALEAAHEQGIVHRDLKPANIKVRPDGVVKVLDFGLAKALAGDPAAVGGPLANSPTFTSPAMTAMGVILGTAAYMAPEQARGKPVDRRADVWAFGCVLYEMLAGRPPFPGDTATDVISAIVTREPDWTALPAATPAAVRRLLRRCLEKDPRQRLQAIGEARIALSGGTEDAVSPVAVTAPTRGRPFVLPLAIVAALGAGAAAAWWLARPTAQAPALVAHLEMSLAPADRLEGRFALSPDGRMISFVGMQAGVRKLYVRRIDSDEATPLVSTEVSDATEPRFSPDGKWIAFDGFGVLEKVSVAGGAPITLARAASSTVSGLAWGPDDTIVFSNPSLGLSKVSASGGEPQVLAMPDAKAGEISLEMPLILPGGKTVLYDVRHAAGSANTGVTTIVAQPLAGGPRRDLFPGVAVGLIGDDQLVVAREADGIFVVPFDTSRGTATGPATPLLQVGTGWQEHLFTTAPLISVSRSGTIAYEPAVAGANDSPLMLVNRSGAATPIDLPPHRYADPRASPDGTRIVVHAFEEGRDNWVVDLRRGTLTRLTFDPDEDETPVWSPDGQWVYWTATRANVVRGIYRKRADGSGAEELLWTGNVHTHLGGLTPDGRTMIIGIVDGPHRLISALHLPDKKVTPLVATPFTNIDPALSPDGKWLAYTSDETGKEEVYVQPYPSMASRVQVSAAGGTEPAWSRRDRQLYYRAAGKLMAVDFEAADRFTASAPHVVIADPYDNTQGNAHTGWDTMPDGRFVFVAKPKSLDAPVTHLKLLYRP